MWPTDRHNEAAKKKIIEKKQLEQNTIPKILNEDGEEIQPIEPINEVKQVKKLLQDDDDSNGEKKSNKCNYQEHNKDDNIIATEEEELNLKHRETIYHVSNEEENTRQHVASNEHIITEDKTESNNKNRTCDEIFKSSFETVNSSLLGDCSGDQVFESVFNRCLDFLNKKNRL